MHRRQFLRLGVGGGFVLTSARAIHNAVLGYGTVGPGKNLRSQDLGRVADRGFALPTARWSAVDGRTLVFDGDTLWIGETGDWITVSVDNATPEDAENVEDRFDLDGSPLTELLSDVRAIDAGAYTFEFYPFDEFFERLDRTRPRHYTTDLLRSRRYGSVNPQLVERFADASPVNPRVLLDALVEAFRERTRYDVPRYLAGSIEDNVLLGAVDLRERFRPTVSFEVLMKRDGTGLFCTEYTQLANAALHSLAAADQRRPLLGLWVHDVRHKHVYNGFASVVRDGNELRMPICFVDYTHTTLYDDYSMTWFRGRDVDAYDTRHRADVIDWGR